MVRIGGGRYLSTNTLCSTVFSMGICYTFRLIDPFTILFHPYRSFISKNLRSPVQLYLGTRGNYVAKTFSNGEYEPNDRTVLLEKVTLDGI